MSDMKNLVLKNRSCRGYDESFSISKETLLELVDLARLSPSSMNRQPLKYYISWEKEEVEEILQATKWAGALPELHLPYEGTHPSAFIVICQDLTIADSPTVFLKDVGITAQTMLLGATEKGLGGLMIGSFNPTRIKEITGMGEMLRPELVIALGKPAEQICLTEVGENGSVTYYRDEAGTHYVPKRSLEDVVLSK